MAQNWTWDSQAAVKKKYGHENEKTFKEEESIEILEILGLIIQKSIRKQIIMPEKKQKKQKKTRIQTAKNRRKKKLFTKRNRSK